MRCRRGRLRRQGLHSAVLRQWPGRRRILRCTVLWLSRWQRTVLWRTVLCLRGRRQRVGLNWPSRRKRGIRDCAGWTQRFVVIAERPAFSQSRHPQRIIGAAHARPGDRRDADTLRAFLHRAGIETGNFGLAAPRFSLAAEVMAAAGERDQRGNDGGAQQRPLNATRHNAQNARQSVKDYSMMSAGARANAMLTMPRRCAALDCAPSFGPHR